MKKIYYVYFTNGLYFDSFTRSQKIKLTKVVNESDIIQQYKENGNLCIQLDYNKKVKDVLSDSMLTPYEKRKEEVRQQAIEWQLSFDDENTTYDQLAYTTEYFEKMGRRYGLLKELKENGII